MNKTIHPDRSSLFSLTITSTTPSTIQSLNHKNDYNPHNSQQPQRTYSNNKHYSSQSKPILAGYLKLLASVSLTELRGKKRTGYAIIDELPLGGIAACAADRLIATAGWCVVSGIEGIWEREGEGGEGYEG